MGEVSLSLLSSAARRAVAVGLIGISAVAAVFSLGAVAANAQEPDPCFADRDAIEAFTDKAPFTYSDFTCTNGKATALDLDGYQFANSELPAEIGGLTNLTRLDLNNNGLVRIPPEIGNLTELTDLKLSGSQITELPPEIGKLTKLTRLNLIRSQITELPPEIGNLTKLTYLHLGYSSLTKLPAEMANLTNLTELYLFDSNFTTVPPVVTKLKKLEKLVVSGNKLVTVPADIDNLTALKELFVDDTELSTLPAEIGNLTGLKTLAISDNNLTTVPSELANLRNLSFLSIENNAFDVLPPQVFASTELIAFNASDNDLTSVPPEIGNLTKLTSLDLGLNTLTSLPPEIGKLTELRTLNLQSNALKSLPAQIGNMRQLEYLYIQQNKLTTLPATIGGLKSVTRFDASNNQITAVPPEIGDMTQVRDLDLRYNKLTTLPAGIANLQNIESLMIGYNNFESLPVEIGELAKRNRDFGFGPGSQDSGLTFPYVAIGSCASGSPALIAWPPGYAGSLGQTIGVNGKAYELDFHFRSGLTTTTLTGAGTGPSFSVFFGGQTRTITCQKPAGSSGTVGDTTLDREVSIARSCLAGNGRIDFNIVNSESDARYRIEFEGLRPRERAVIATEAWRMPFTGRKDGTYTVTVTKTLLADNTTQAITRDFAVDCDATSPKELSQEVEVIPYCVAGRGFVRYQFVNPTGSARSYIITMSGLTTRRSTTARAYGAASSGFPGRPDGTYKTTVEYGDLRGTPIHTQDVTINCANR